MTALKEGCLILLNASRGDSFPSFLCLSPSPPPFAPDERRRLRLEGRNEGRIEIRHVGDVGSGIQNDVLNSETCVGGKKKKDDGTSSVVFGECKKTDSRLISKVFFIYSPWSPIDIFSTFSTVCNCVRVPFSTLKTHTDV